MSFAPDSLQNLEAYWLAHGGKSLGILADEAHIAKGVSYHLGRDHLTPDAYSRKHPRDKKGLSNAASAIDLWTMNKSYVQLRAFSRWLAGQCLAGACLDIREVIFSPDGRHVFGYKQGVNKLIPDYGDASHKGHTHISFFRDSEASDKIRYFRPYFEVVWGDDVPDEIKAIDRKAVRVAAAVRQSGHNFGSRVDLGDLIAAMQRTGQDFGQFVNVQDVQKLVRNAAT
jgi:hypothetical protein